MVEALHQVFRPLEEHLVFCQSIRGEKAAKISDNGFEEWDKAWLRSRLYSFMEAQKLRTFRTKNVVSRLTCDFVKSAFRTIFNAR